MYLGKETNCIFKLIKKVDYSFKIKEMTHTVNKTLTQELSRKGSGKKVSSGNHKHL